MTDHQPKEAIWECHINTDDYYLLEFDSAPQYFARTHSKSSVARRVYRRVYRGVTFTVIADIGRLVRDAMQVH